MFSIPNTKSPGHDSFSSGFFKATWHITGELVREVIHLFVRNWTNAKLSWGKLNWSCSLRSLTPHKLRSLDQYLAAMSFINL